MALFGVSPAYAGYPQTVTVAGQVVVTASGAQPANTQIVQANLLPSNGTQGAQLGPQASLLPYSPKVAAIVNPTSAYKPAVAAGADARVLMLDFSGQPANIVSVQLQTKLSSAANGVMSFTPTQGVLLDFDQTNKFIFCGLFNLSSQALVNWAAGAVLMYNITLCDCPYP